MALGKTLLAPGLTLVAWLLEKKWEHPEMDKWTNAYTSKMSTQRIRTQAMNQIGGGGSHRLRLAQRLCPAGAGSSQSIQVATRAVQTKKGASDGIWWANGGCK